MKELIRVDIRPVGDTAVQTCSARDLHAFLEVGKVFAAWIQERIEQYGFEKGKDFEVFSDSGNNPQGGRPTKEYSLTLNMAKELAMVERNQKGKEARQYFIECERIAKEQSRHSSPTPSLTKRAAFSLTDRTRSYKIIADMMVKMGVKPEMAAAAMLQALHTDAGATIEPFRLALPAIEDVCNLNQKQLGDILGVSSREIGRLLRESGLMEDDESGQRIVTKKGKKFGEMKPYRHGNGHCGYEPRWNPSVADYLTRDISA
jgi:phage anti-repressor protein